MGETRHAPPLPQVFLCLWGAAPEGWACGRHKGGETRGVGAQWTERRDGAASRAGRHRPQANLEGPGGAGAAPQGPGEAAEGLPALPPGIWARSASGEGLGGEAMT